MPLLAMVLWGIASIFLVVMIIRGAIRCVKYSKRPEKPGRLLSFREEQLWLSGLVVLLLMVRYFIVYAMLFQNNPNPALDGALLKQYLLGLLFALVWPAQIVDLVGSIVLLVINRAWKHKSAAPRRAVRFHRIVLIAVCSMFLVLITTISFMCRLRMVSLASAYTVFLFSKCIALVMIVMSMSEDPNRVKLASCKI